jgi:hypothetical protein
VDAVGADDEVGGCGCVIGELEADFVASVLGMVI